MLTLGKAAVLKPSKGKVTHMPCRPVNCNKVQRNQCTTDPAQAACAALARGGTGSCSAVVLTGCRWVAASVAAWQLWLLGCPRMEGSTMTLLLLA